MQGKKGFYDRFVKALSQGSCAAVKTSPELEKSVQEYLEFPCDIPAESFDGLCTEQLLALRVIHELSKCLNFEDSAKAHISDTEADKKKTDAAILLELVNFSETVTLAEIAYRMNYSVKHTARLIKEQYGTTYSELIRTRRLESAKKLLNISRKEKSVTNTASFLLRVQRFSRMISLAILPLHQGMFRLILRIPRSSIRLQEKGIRPFM